MRQLTESGFDRVAYFYDPLAKLVFRDAQQQAQKVLLPFIKPDSDVLIIGGGSGWLLEQVLNSGKTLRLLYLDASPKMVQMTRERVRKHVAKRKLQVEYRVGSEQTLLPGETFDVVFTPFLLDLFPEKRLTELMTILKAALREDGQWLFADFWPVKHPTPHWQKLLLKSMYLFFRVMSGVQATELPDFNSHFKQLQMQEMYTNAFYTGMIQAKVFTRSTA